jgi:ankyrin repeat protein
MAKEIIGDHIPDPEPELDGPPVAPLPPGDFYVVGWLKSLLIWIALLLGAAATFFLGLEYHEFFPDATFIQPLGYTLYPAGCLVSAFFAYKWLRRKHLCSGYLLLLILLGLAWLPICYLATPVIEFTKDPGEPLVHNLRYSYPQALALIAHDNRAWPKNRDGVHPLTYAIQHQQNEAVRLLAPRYVSRQESLPGYPTVTAAGIRNRNIMQLLVDLGYQFHEPNPSIIILDSAQVHADYDWIQFLLQLGIDPRTKGFWNTLTPDQQQAWAPGILAPEKRNGMRILQILRHYTVENRETLFPRIQTLLHNPVDLTLRDYQTFNGVAYAIEYEDVPLLDLFAQHGALLTTPAYGQTPPVVFAAEKDNLQILAYLVQHGAPADQPNQRGITAAMIAASRNNLAMLQQLRSAHANIWQRDSLNRGLEDLTTSPAVKLYILQEKKVN